MAKISVRNRKGRTARRAGPRAPLTRRDKGEAPSQTGAIARWTPPPATRWEARDVPLHPFDVMRRFSDEVDRWFDSLAGGSPPRARLWAPAIELFQGKGALVLRADLPGLRPEDVKVELTDEGLVLEGERRAERDEKHQFFHRAERSYGRFRRLIPLPRAKNAWEAKARFKDGVLEVSLALPADALRGRRIPIETR